MYIAIVVSLMFVLPIISILSEAVIFRSTTEILFLVGKWLSQNFRSCSRIRGTSDTEGNVHFDTTIPLGGRLGTFEWKAVIKDGKFAGRYTNNKNYSGGFTSSARKRRSKLLAGDASAKNSAFPDRVLPSANTAKT